MLKEIYLVISERLRTITELKEVSWYTRQDMDNETEMFTVPVAYIEFDKIDMLSLPNNVQMVERQLKFKVRLVTESLEALEDGMIKHLDLSDEVYLALQGFNFVDSATEQQIINSIRRTAIMPDHTISNLIVSVQSFEAIAFDYGVEKKYVKKNPTLKIQLIK
jgi:hypothetical protein